MASWTSRADLGRGAAPSEGPGWGQEEPAGGEPQSLVNPRRKVFSPSPRETHPSPRVPARIPQRSPLSSPRSRAPLPPAPASSCSPEAWLAPASSSPAAGFSRASWLSLVPEPRSSFCFLAAWPSAIFSRSSWRRVSRASAARALCSWKPCSCWRLKDARACGVNSAGTSGPRYALP